MDANSLLMNRFKLQCNKFSGTISKNLGKVKKRLVKEMIYGIQASKDVKLSNISRALMEPVPLIKTEDRLSRNLSDEDLTCTINNHIMRQLLQELSVFSLLLKAGNVYHTWGQHYPYWLFQYC
jgi:hypothetical protein